ncbi:MAG: hypothetical protein FJX56_03620 [Alphaproteobacteria bacterium]|nr:hypothetical protein [Alphaproteobacteria bacterium]
MTLLTTAGRLDRSQSWLARTRASASNVFFMPYLSITGMLEALEVYDRAIRRVGQRTGAAVFEAAGVVPGDGTHYADSGHFRDAGSRRMAAWLAASLINHPGFRALVEARR